MWLDLVIFNVINNCTYSARVVRIYSHVVKNCKILNDFDEKMKLFALGIDFDLHELNHRR